MLYFSLQDLLTFVRFYVCVGKFLCRNNFLGPRPTEDDRVLPVEEAFCMDPSLLDKGKNKQNNKNNKIWIFKLLLFLQTPIHPLHLLVWGQLHFPKLNPLIVFHNFSLLLSLIV